MRYRTAYLYIIMNMFIKPTPPRFRILQFHGVGNNFLELFLENELGLQLVFGFLWNSLRSLHIAHRIQYYVIIVTNVDPQIPLALPYNTRYLKSEHTSQRNAGCSSWTPIIDFPACDDLCAMTSRGHTHGYVTVTSRMIADKRVVIAGKGCDRRSGEDAAERRTLPRRWEGRSYVTSRPEFVCLYVLSCTERRR